MQNTIGYRIISKIELRYYIVENTIRNTGKRTRSPNYTYNIINLTVPSKLV